MVIRQEKVLVALVLAISTASLALPRTSLAQSFPVKPLRLVLLEEDALSFESEPQATAHRAVAAMNAMAGARSFISARTPGCS